MALKVCLIVDNPLRDLDGIVLLAWQLAQRGAEVWLVPMYEQGFDVFAIRPDWVVMNYIRPNNLDLVRLYRRAGMSVCVLDTEGAGGKTAQEFAGMVGQSGGADLCDLYCVWGDGQMAALQEDGRVPAGALRLTGCPRYDYCADPWRNTLPPTSVAPGFVLVNTNFPVVNPRFSSGADGEKRSMMQAGFSAGFADAYIRDAKVALDGVVAMLQVLLARFPEQQFVLRPHPFESVDAYQSLQDKPNFQLRQEGTSIQWLNQCALLLHLNCSTAVEAAMLGREALSLAWLDTPALRVPAPSEVSRHAGSIDELVTMVGAVLQGQRPAADAAVAARRQHVISSVYHAIDGLSAQRVAQALMDFDRGTLRDPHVAGLSLRGRLVHWSRHLLGYRLASAMRRRLGDQTLAQRRTAKRFGEAEVRGALDRLSAAKPDAVRLQVADGSRVAPSRLASGTAVRVSRNSAPMRDNPSTY